MQRIFERYPGTSWRLALFALTIPLVVVSAVFIWQDYQSRRDAITTQVMLQAVQVNGQLEDFVHTVEGVSGQFASHWTLMYPNGEAEPTNHHASQESFLNDFETFKPYASLALITDLSGGVQLSTDSSVIGQRIGPEALFQQARATGDFTVSDVVHPPDGSAPFALFVTPLIYEGEPGGFLVVRSSLDAISSSLDMGGVDFPKTGKSGIFDSQGRILAGTGYEEPHPGLLAGLDISGSPLWAEAVSRPETCWFGPGLDNVDRIVFFEYPDATPWVTTVAYAQSELFDPLWDRLWIFGGALAATVAAVLVMGEFVIRRERRGVVMLKSELGQRQKAEQALTVSESRFRQLFDDAPIGYQEVDVAGRITRVNQTELAMLGYQSDEILGKPVWSLMADQKKARQIIGSKIEGARSPGGAYELGIRRKDGTTVPALLEDRLIQDETGEVTGLRSTIHDITEQKKTEQQISEAGRLSSLGELAAGVAHEINNPLTEVMGFSEMLMEQDLPEQAARYVKRINAGSQRAARIGKKLLDFARKREPTKQYVHVPDFLTKALELKQLGPEIEVETRWSENDLPNTLVDEHQMTQVVINLLSNSEHALRDRAGTGRIVLGASYNDGRVRISVTDNGPGIAPEHLHNIFDPFFTTKQVGDGTGLGLSLCYGIVRQHGGEIWAESTVGEGTTINVELPIISVEFVDDHQLDDVPVNGNGRSKQKILVVDDEPGIRDLLLDMLSRDGHKVDQAADGGQATGMIAKNTYDCIIMDLKMPKVSGQGLYERLAKVDPALADRVIFITGDTIAPDTKEFLERTHNPVVNKPFNLKELRQHIENVALNHS